MSYPFENENILEIISATAGNEAAKLKANPNLLNQLRNESHRGVYNSKNQKCRDIIEEFTRRVYAIVVPGGDIEDLEKGGLKKMITSITAGTLDAYGCLPSTEVDTEDWLSKLEFMISDDPMVRSKCAKVCKRFIDSKRSSLDEIKAYPKLLSALQQAYPEFLTETNS